MIMAALNGHESIVALLLDRGAEIHHANNEVRGVTGQGRKMRRMTEKESARRRRRVIAERRDDGGVRERGGERKRERERGKQECDSELEDVSGGGRKCS